jgi:hypothetical protein
METGIRPSDSDELRVRKAVLVLSTTLMGSLACVWVVTYASLGLWLSAAIPFVYQLASLVSVWGFSRMRRYVLFRDSQLCMSLLLPFALQWSLGGFEASSAVCIWALTSPLGALLFMDARRSLPWFVAFGGLVAISAAIDPALANGAADMPNAVVVTFFALNILGTSTTAYALLTYFVRARERAHRALEAEQAKSERLLLNVLPKPVAARLKEREGIIADDFPTASSPAGTHLPPRTASRRSRPSATRTWPLPAFQFPATTTPRPSPTWRLRWGPSWRGAPPN